MEGTRAAAAERKRTSGSRSCGSAGVMLADVSMRQVSSLLVGGVGALNNTCLSMMMAPLWLREH